MDIHNGALALDVAVDGRADAPPVVVLHGITSSTRGWDWLVPHLAGRCRVIRLDFRGHGGSARAPGAYDMPGYVSDAAAVCEQVAGAPAIIVGHSLGGSAAAGLAQIRPDLVRAVVLEDPPLGGASPTLDGNALLDGFRLMRETIPTIQAQGMTPAALAALIADLPSARGGTFGEVLTDDAIDTMALGLLAVDAAVLDPVLDATIGTVFDPGRPIPVPTLLVTADPDAVARPVDAERLAATTPDAKVVVMTGVGHQIHSSRAGRGAFLDLVVDFVDATIS